MTKKNGTGPGFRTAEEHDVYLFGLMCGAVESIRTRCEDPSVVGIEPVEEALSNIAAFLENAMDYADNIFETDLKAKLAGTRISTEAITNAWEMGLRNGLQTEVGPHPEIALPRRR